LKWDWSKIGHDEFVCSVLAAVIEIASVKTYEQYQRKHLFAPAGMRSTGYNFAEAELAQAALVQAGTNTIGYAALLCAGGDAER
jgi:CubicO group peptidase (beta-lactamase class C family)